MYNGVYCVVLELQRASSETIVCSKCFKTCWILCC